MMYNVIMTIFAVIVFMNIITTTNSLIKLNQIEKLNGKIQFETPVIRNELDKDVYEKYIKYKPVDKKKYEIKENNDRFEMIYKPPQREPTMINNNTPKEFNPPKTKKDFIHQMKDRCKLVDGKYIISKEDVAVIMNRYNETTERIFSGEYMTIYDKYYITQKGINYIDKSKYVKSVCNDLVNRSLVIDFYKDEEVLVEDDTATSHPNVIDVSNHLNKTA